MKLKAKIVVIGLALLILSPGAAHFAMAGLPPGTIRIYVGATPPEGWMICNGAEVCRCCFPDLFQVIGTTYGDGDGVETFELPDLRGRIVVGHDASDPDFDELGKTGGSKTNVLTEANLPAHTHTISLATSSDGAHTHTSSLASGGAHHHEWSASGHSMRWVGDRDGGDGSTGDPIVHHTEWQDTFHGTVDSAGAHTHTVSIDSVGNHTHTVSGTTGSSGGGAAHNIMQPFMALNFIIKY